MVENSIALSPTAANVRIELIFLQGFRRQFYLCKSTSLARLPNSLGSEEVTLQSIALCYIVKCNHENAVS